MAVYKKASAHLYDTNEKATNLCTCGAEDESCDNVMLDNSIEEDSVTDNI